MRHGGEGMSLVTMSQWRAMTCLLGSMDFSIHVTNLCVILSVSFQSSRLANPNAAGHGSHLVLWWQAVFGEFYLSIASETIQPIVVSKVTTISIETWGCATILVIAKSKCYISRGIRVAQANKWLHFSTKTKSREITTKLIYSCFAQFLGNIK